MTVTVLDPGPAAPLRYRSACRGCGAHFEFDDTDAARTYSFPNHVLTLPCPSCGTRLVWALPPHGLSVVAP